MRTYLYVPFAEKDEAKALGAQWDPARSRWYVNGPLEASFARWFADEIVALAGEDRTFGGRALYVDLIPTSCWFKNVRSAVVPMDWERIRHFVYDRAAHTCEICGVPARKEIDAHERWHYDDAIQVQRLVRLLALCKRCHHATHYGFSMINGHEDEAFEQLCAVNKWDAETASDHIDEAFETWKARNARPWTLDLSIFDGTHVTFTQH